MKRIAILGAGVAGLAAAWALRNAAIEVILFEKSRGLGGRVATRGREGIRYDHGANYFCADSERIRQLIFTDLPTDNLVEITPPVRPFHLSESPADAGPVPSRWNYRNGISQLAKLLAAASGARIKHEVRIERMVQHGSRWSLVAEGEQIFDGFDAVLLTPPAPQSAAIVESSDMACSLRYSLSKGLRQARYESQLCFVLGYTRTETLDVDWYAQVDIERRHPVAWMAVEHAKPGHVPAGHHVLLVQMAPSWSARRYLEPFDALLPDVLAQVRTLLPSLPAPDWYDGQRWRFARATRPADTAALGVGNLHGLFAAGDAIAPRSRVEHAIESGLDAAAKIRQLTE